MAVIASWAPAGISVSGVGEVDAVGFLIFGLDDFVDFDSDRFGFLVGGCCGADDDSESDEDDEESGDDIGSEDSC